LGIDYDSLAAINPRIILASISGFGEDGPYRNRPGFDQIAQGMGGMMSVTGIPGQGPVRAGIAIADSSAGVFAATGILIALLERESSGQGQWVQSNLLHCPDKNMSSIIRHSLAINILPMGKIGVLDSELIMK
jgi:crotonobetainyl-CoA:carnitine CoA-transferase CaiB-like acyl-CoA transferase